MLSYGKNVLFSTNPKLIKKVYISNKLKDKEVLNYLEKNHLHYDLLPLEVINQKCHGLHQGILILRDDYEYTSLEELLTFDFLVILDHLEDPHNFGAIIRTCEAAGVKGIIIPKDRSVSVNDVVIKTSVGTSEYLKICKVTNIVETIKKLKNNNYFVYGSIMTGKDYREVSYAPKKVLIIGNEGKGISPLVLKNCDELIKIPMKGKVNSLNASVASALLIYKMGDMS